MGPVVIEQPSGAVAPARPGLAQASPSQPSFAAEYGTVVGLAAAAVLLHFLVSGRYGYFRDELYYAACGEHLAWGYVDHAPLVAVVARLSRWLLGDSLFALRFFPALAGGAKVLLAGWLARELGGRRFAGVLAAAAVLAAPVYLAFDNFLSMNAFEPIFWTLAAAVAIRSLSPGSDKLWLLFGLVAGIGLLNKHSMLFFGSGVFVGLLATRERRLFRSKWIWLGGLLAFALFLPNLIWEARHDWPTIENLRNDVRLKNAPATPLEFVLDQALLTQPLAAPIWLGGLYFFLRDREGRRFRFLGWGYLVLLAEFLLLKGKIYYLAPVYPVLLAAGAVWLERWAAVRRKEWLKPAALAALLLGGMVAAPLALPLLPVKQAARYAAFWHVESVRVERPESGRLPQLFAEMFGWQNQASTVARVYRSLPADERSKCAILAGNYGEAAAIDYFGPAFGLPKAISGNNNYYLWGPRAYSGEVVISFGVRREDLEGLFGEVAQAAVIESPYAVPDETDLPVYICRAPKMPLRLAWPRFKDYS